ncbi:MAG: tripartite tricarboxylate transporter substrate binding protein, partial [Alphaproteobacteria bacterium]|nr:tripartite tricarboxylate transporter substrate binding protein [Alphaproteobacteria bacterium]
MLLRIVAALATLMLAATAGAQAWPTKPVRLIVASSAGSSLDIPARLVAERLRDKLAHPILVENRVGAGGTIAVAEAAKAAPDGHTLALGFNGPLAYAPFLYSKLPYDPIKDLAPVILMGGQPFVLGVAASLEVGSVRDLVTLFRRNPGRYNYSSLGNGSGSHLSMELLKSRETLYVVHIPYAGGPAAAQAVATGEVAAAFLPGSVYIPHVQAGRVKQIAVSTRERWNLLPELPGMGEAGPRDFHSDGWNGIVAPAGTPRDVIMTLNRAINTVLEMPDV